MFRPDRVTGGVPRRPAAGRPRRGWGVLEYSRGACDERLARASGSEQRAPQRVQPDRAEVQRRGVEGLGVERIPLAAAQFVPDLFPETLAQLVGRCLARPAEVAGELEFELAFADRDVPAQELVALLRGPYPCSPAGRYLELQVHPD